MPLERSRQLIGGVWRYVTADQSDDGGGGGGEIASPLDIPDLALWLDASTLALADDDPVETWPDASGNGYDATANLTNEIATVFIFTADGGTYTLQAGATTVGPIAFDADAAAIQAAFTTAGITTSCTFGGDSGALTDVDVEFIGAFGGIVIAVSVANDSTTGGDPGANVFFTEDTSGGVSSAPVCKTGVLNGKRVIRFDASGDPAFQYLALTGDGLDLFRDVEGLTIAAVATNIPDQASVFLVSACDNNNLAAKRAELRLDASSGGPLYLTGSNEDGGDGGEISASATDVMAAPSDDDLSGPATVSGAADFVIGSVLVESSQFVKDHDVPSFGTNRGPAPDTASLAVNIGATSDVASGSSGDIAEIVVYQRALNARERREVIEYLSAKWATL